MAYVQRTPLAKYARYARKKLHTVRHGLRASALKGRFSGPRVLLNSVPKSGTHLVESALERFPLMRNAGWRTLMSWDSANDDVLRRLRGIGRGKFATAHLTASPEIWSTVKAQGVKVVFVIRDPRDVVVSRYKYATEIDLTHFAHETFRDLPDDRSRLMASIRGVPGVLPPIGESLARFAPWLGHDDVYVCRFERLVGARGGGEDQQQRAEMNDIAEFLGIEVTDEDLDRICELTFSTRSSTYRKGQIGGWRAHFEPEHVVAFKEAAANMLVTFGYEVDDHWTNN